MRQFREIKEEIKKLKAFIKEELRRK